MASGLLPLRDVTGHKPHRRDEPLFRGRGSGYGFFYSPPGLRGRGATGGGLGRRRRRGPCVFGCSHGLDSVHDVRSLHDEHGAHRGDDTRALRMAAARGRSLVLRRGFHVRPGVHQPPSASGFTNPVRGFRFMVPAEGRPRRPRALFGGGVVVGGDVDILVSAAPFRDRRRPKLGQAAHAIRPVFSPYVQRVPTPDVQRALGRGLMAREDRGLALSGSVRLVGNGGRGGRGRPPRLAAAPRFHLLRRDGVLYAHTHG